MPTNTIGVSGMGGVCAMTLYDACMSDGMPLVPIPPSPMPPTNTNNCIIRLLLPSRTHTHTAWYALRAYGVE